MSAATQLVAKFGNTIQTPEFQSKITAALPSNVSPDRFTRCLLTAWQTNPDILTCDATSVYTAVLVAAQQGLVPDGREGAIVKYGQRAQFLPMVAGIIKRFAEAGVSVYAGSVYESDEFRAWNDDAGQHVRHAPKHFGDRGEWLGCYAVASLNGTTYVEIAGIDELNRIRAASRGAVRPDGTITGPWAQWPERMGQKSMLHRLGRRVPIPAVNDAAERLARTIEADRDGFAEPAQAAQEPAQAAKPAGPRRPSVFDAIAGQEAAREPVTVDAEPTDSPETASDAGYPGDF